MLTEEAKIIVFIPFIIPYWQINIFNETMYFVVFNGSSINQYYILRKNSHVSKAYRMEVPPIYYFIFYY